MTYRFPLLFLALFLVACSEPSSSAAVPTQTVVAAAVPTAALPPVEASETPTAEALPTPTIALLTPTATAVLEAVVVEAAEPCGVILPILVEEPEAITAELPDVEIPESVPEAALPALKRLLDAPETVGLAAYQIGFPANGVYHNADVPMPLASVVKLIDLIAYAQGANDGDFNPGDWIPLSEMERYYLPGTDLGSHRLALQDLKERNLIALDPLATPLEEIPWLMMRFSSNAAADYLHMAIGQRRIEETAVALGLTKQTAPCPFIGQFLAMSNHEREETDREVIEGYIAAPDFYGEEVIRLTQLYASDETFRQDEIDLRGRNSLPVQSFFSENLNAKGSAGEYADLMARIFDNGLNSGYMNIVVRRNLEWPMIFPANQEIFTTVGYKNGAFPGILTTVYYAQRIEDGGRVVVALFYRGLPEAMYRDWRRNLYHDEFARWLLSDPQAIPTLRALLAQ